MVPLVCRLAGDTLRLAAVDDAPASHPDSRDRSAGKHARAAGEHQRTLGGRISAALSVLDHLQGRAPEWRDWATVVAHCRRAATLMAFAVATRRAGWNGIRG